MPATVVNVVSTTARRRVFAIAAICLLDSPRPRVLSYSLSAQSNLTNGYLEDCTQYGTAPNTYYQPDGGFFGTLNELVDLLAMIGGPGPVTIDRVTDAYQGSYAAKATSKQFYEIFLPGMIGTTTLDIANETIYLGRPYTNQPYSFTGHYKYAPVGGDHGEILIFCVP